MKKILTFSLALLMVLSIFISIPPIEAEAATTITESDFAAKISTLKSKYPDGQYWNEDNGTEKIGGETVAKAGTIACTGTRKDAAHNGQKCTSVGVCSFCTCHCGYFYGWQCFGFANLMASHIFG